MRQNSVNISELHHATYGIDQDRKIIRHNRVNDSEPRHATFFNRKGIRDHLMAATVPQSNVLNESRGVPGESDQHPRANSSTPSQPRSARRPTYYQVRQQGRRST